MENFRLLSSKDLRNKATVLITGLFVALNFIQIILENLLSINSYVINLISHYLVLFAVMLFLLHLTKNYPLDRCFYLLSLLILYETVIAFIGIFGSDNSDKITLIAKYLFSLTFPISLYVFQYNSFSRKTIRVFLLFNVWMSLLFIVLFFSDKAYSFEGGYIDWLTLNFSNPNLTAMVLMGNLGLLILSFAYFKNSLFKLLLFILSVAVFYFIYETNGRLTMIISIYMLICIGLKMEVKRWYIKAIILFPVLFLVVYSLMFQIEGLKELTILGKPLFSGRVELWQEKLALLEGKWLYWIFGNYKVLQLENLHNGPVSVLSNFGIVGFLLYHYYLYKVTVKCFAGVNTKTANKAKHIILAFILLMTAEAATYLSGSYIGFYYIITLIVLNEERRKAKCKIINGTFVSLPEFKDKP